MTKKERALEIIGRLEEIYPESVCALEYGGDPWRLLVMGRLSAQCTDARVNIVCRELFEVFPTVYDMAAGDIAEIERIVRPCGLYRVKAANLRDCAIMLINDFDGRLPDTMEELLLLPGVGRKIANLLLGDIYKKPAIVADTHCIRITRRMGLTPKGQSDPYRTEKALLPLIPPEKSSDFCHRIVQFGRDTCTARSPKCEDCPIADLCKKQA